MLWGVSLINRIDTQGARANYDKGLHFFRKLWEVWKSINIIVIIIVIVIVIVIVIIIIIIITSITILNFFFVSYFISFSY